MASSRVVLFIGDNPFYLSGYVNSKSYIRGYVENGGYNLYITKDEASWAGYSATSRQQCTERNRLGVPFDGASATHVAIPETMRADYNTIINWARRQKREKTNVGPS